MNKDEFQSKRMLLISTLFFGYYKEIIQQYLEHHTDGAVDYPQVHVFTDALSYHIQAPEQAEYAEGQVFIIDFAENEARDWKQEHTEKAHQNKQQKRRQRIKKELQVTAVSKAQSDLERVRKIGS